jgi:peptidyl-prolyl cis-trans isomerase A (cyclophilin A)
MNRFIVFASLLLLLSGCTHSHPKVLLKTSLGDIVVEIYTDKAPVTAANFLKYVDNRRFKDATFYRVVTPDNQPGNDVKIEVIQGGLFEDNHPDALLFIKHEATKQTGLKHLDGTISMARNEPGTASSEFFICVGNQPELDYGGRRNPDGQGFAAFGRVIEGMDVVRKIQMLPSDEQMLVEKVTIEQVKRVE